MQGWEWERGRVHTWAHWPARLTTVRLKAEIDNRSLELAVQLASLGRTTLSMLSNLVLKQTEP